MTGPCRFLVCCLATAAAAQGPSPSLPVAAIVLPAGTQLPVSIPGHLPMKLGEPVQARLLYPVYAGNRLVLPANTIVNGSVVALTPDHAHRVQSRLRVDFTPFVVPAVRFQSIILPGGAVVPITTGIATDGAPIYRAVAPPPRHGGFFRQHFDEAVQFAKDRLAVITGPDKADRALQFLYTQLPYHPQRINKGTVWTVETDAPVDLAAADLTEATPPPMLPADTDAAPTWLLQAYLTTPISSETSKPGQLISATVAEPIYNHDGSLAVAQGSVLTGSVTQARPARKFARPGELRFSFRQITLPNAAPQNVRAALTAADTSSPSQLALDSEGNAKPKPQDKLVVPFILLALAARPLHHEHEDNQFGRDAGASNSLGLIGFLIGTAARNANIAAAIGYYGAALSIYSRIFARGKPVAFMRDTRVVVQTSPTEATPMRASTPEPGTRP